MDYLDPIGESPIEALERRFKWAERSVDDPALAEEANFLLTNAEDLREIARASVVSDEWMDEEPSGIDEIPEIRDTPVRREVVREDLSDVFQDDEDPDHQPTGIMRLEDLTDKPAPKRIVAPTPVFRDPWEEAEADAAALAEAVTPAPAKPRTHAQQSIPPSYLAQTPGAVRSSHLTPKPVRRAAVPKAPQTSLEGEEADDEQSNTILVSAPKPVPVPLPRDGRTIVPDDLDDELPPGHATHQPTPLPEERATAIPAVSSAQAVPRKRSDPTPIQAPIRERPRAAGPMLGGVFALGLLLVGGWYATQQLNTAPPPAPEPAPVPTAAPTPPPPPPPEPVVAPVPAEPAAAVAEPAPAPTAPVPAAPAPKPAPATAAPAPKPTPDAPKPAPKPDPAPAPAPEPAPAAAPAVSLAGGWSGYLNTTGESLSLSVTSDSGGSFGGSVSVNIGGAPKTIPVTGSLDAATGAMRFSGSDFSFSGTLTGSAARGTCTVLGTAEKCSLKH